MPIAPEFQAYELLPLPVLIVEGDMVIYGNQMHRETTGVGLPPLPVRVSELIEHAVDTSEQQGLQSLQSEVSRGNEVPHENWVTMRATAAHPCRRTFRVVRTPAPVPGRWVLTFHEAEKESAARQVTEGLVAAANELLACRRDDEVLEVACRAVWGLGYYCASFILEGEFFRHGPISVDPRMLAAVEAAAGMPVTKLRVPRSALSSEQWHTMFAEQRAILHPDLYVVIERAYTPEILAELRRAFPVMRQLDAPLFAEGKPYGFLALSAPELPPSVAAAMELFAKMVSSGLENVRQHRLATQRLDQLEKLQQELVAQERLAALGEAAALVAHEVRNPLGSIVNCVTLLRRPTATSSGGRVLEMLEEEAFRLERLVRHLLDYTRPLQPERRRMSMAELLRASIRAIEERGEAATVRFSVSVEGDDSIEADETLMQVAMENLLRNSVQVSPPGSVVRTRVIAVRREVRLQVEDDGPGIPTQHHARVFEPFFTTRASGSGLGLPLVKRIAEAHGGRVQFFEPQPGKAALQIVLPSAEG